MRRRDAVVLIRVQAKPSEKSIKQLRWRILKMRLRLWWRDLSAALRARLKGGDDG